MVQVSSFSGLAILCGLALGLGLWSLASLLPSFGRPRLANRVAPYIVDVSPAARQLLARRSIEPMPIVGAFFSPVAMRARVGLDRMLGGTSTIELRLRQSASALGVDRFRFQQLSWALGSAVLGIAVAVALGSVQLVPIALQVAGVIALGAAGAVVRDVLLQRAAAARLARMTSELPTVLEFLTLSLSAGEGILDALRRVSRASNGEIAAEFGAVIAAVNTGVPLADALASMSSSLQLPVLSRVVEQVSGALERGTPLAEVLGAQADDSRQAARRELIETAGRKEVAMLVPLVFLILPLTIAFAIFPGLAVLQIGI
ncbi:MAG: pilus assembly protein [Microbacteriaceae bacterium]|nr:pilus assembly protein [Microbacteriaceae bacterium]